MNSVSGVRIPRILSGQGRQDAAQIAAAAAGSRAVCAIGYQWRAIGFLGELRGRLAARHGVVVTGYRDDASGTMTEHAELAQRLHDTVDELCFIARSVNFPVRHQPITAVAG